MRKFFLRYSLTLFVLLLLGGPLHAEVVVDHHSKAYANGNEAGVVKVTPAEVREGEEDKFVECTTCFTTAQPLGCFFYTVEALPSGKEFFPVQSDQYLILRVFRI